eukprot:582465-Rhodomonas_salina.4
MLLYALDATFCPTTSEVVSLSEIQRRHRPLLAYLTRSFLDSCVMSDPSGMRVGTSVWGTLRLPRPSTSGVRSAWPSTPTPRSLRPKSSLLRPMDVCSEMKVVVAWIMEFERHVDEEAVVSETNDDTESQTNTAPASTKKKPQKRTPRFLLRARSLHCICQRWMSACCVGSCRSADAHVHRRDRSTDGRGLDSQVPGLRGLGWPCVAGQRHGERRRRGLELQRRSCPVMHLPDLEPASVQTRDGTRKL